MSEEIRSIDQVRLEAQSAAHEAREPRSACPYPLDSTAGRLWLIEYVKTVNRLKLKEKPPCDD